MKNEEHSVTHLHDDLALDICSPCFNSFPILHSLLIDGVSGILIILS